MTQSEKPSASADPAAAPSESTQQEEEQQAPEASPEEKLNQQLQAEKDRYLYLYAEFENFKKRAVKERSEGH